MKNLDVYVPISMWEQQTHNMKEHIVKLLEKQEQDIINYMNTYMTQEERDRHSENIMWFVLKPQSVAAQLDLIGMANG